APTTCRWTATPFGPWSRSGWTILNAKPRMLRPTSHPKQHPGGLHERGGHRNQKSHPALWETRCGEQSEFERARRLLLRPVRAQWRGQDHDYQVSIEPAE